MQFYIWNKNGQIFDRPGGEQLGGSGNPLPVYRQSEIFTFQFFDGPFENGVYPPMRLPAGTTFEYGFKPKNPSATQQYEGDWTVQLDPSSVVRPVSGTGQGYLVNIGPGYAVGRTIIAVDGGTGTIIVGDVVTIGNFNYTVSVALASGSFSIAAPGLQEIVPDNTPVFVNAEAGFYTGLFQGDTAAMRALLLTPDGNPADDKDGLPAGGQLLWVLPTDVTGAPPHGTQFIEGLFKNTFTTGSASPVAVNTAYIVTSTSAPAMVGKGYAVDTTAAAVTMTLPATPSLGDAVSFVDAQGTFATHNLTVARNGNSIGASATDLVASTNNAAFTLIYVGGTMGWQVVRIQ